MSGLLKSFVSKSLSFAGKWQQQQIRCKRTKTKQPPNPPKADVAPKASGSGLATTAKLDGGRPGSALDGARRGSSRDPASFMKRWKRTRNVRRIELSTHYAEVNYRTGKAVIFYGPNIDHVPHDVRSKHPNLPLQRRGLGRGQNI